MKLFEYEAANLLRSAGVPFPKFGVATNPSEARQLSEQIGLPVVVKAQVLVGGRGKAGGIKLANSPDEVEKVASALIGSEIRGERVRKVMVAEAVKVAKELYLSLTIDRSYGSYLFMASMSGGVDIEEIAKTSPESIVKVHVDPLVGLQPFHKRRLLDGLDLPANCGQQLSSMLDVMYELATKYGFELVEINPLALTEREELKALDVKAIIDDNYVRIKGAPVEREQQEEGLEEEAKRYGFTYVELDGDIGIIGNGAGLTMATMDLVKLHGGKPANFLDIGGTASAETVYNAINLLLKNKKVKLILVNVLGGIVRCDEVALGLVKAMKESCGDKKIVIRLVGTNEEIGRKILAEHGYTYLESMEEAAKVAVELVSQS